MPCLCRSIFVARLDWAVISIPLVGPPDPFLERIIGAALEVRATQPERPGRILLAPLTDAELQVLKLLPTTGYVQMAATCTSPATR
jgi:hypothetical protein